MSPSSCGSRGSSDGPGPPPTTGEVIPNGPLPSPAAETKTQGDGEVKEEVAPAAPAVVVTPVPDGTPVTTEGDGSEVVPVPVVVPVGGQVTLPAEPLKLSDPFVEWKLNIAKVLTGAPETVSKTFTIRTNETSFISFNFEHKSYRDCIGAYEFFYKIVVEEVDAPPGSEPRHLPLDGCLMLDGMKNYQVILSMVNFRSCDSIGLEFGIAARSNCR